MFKSVIIAVLMLVASVSLAQTTPCKGKTKSGAPCKSVIVDKKIGFCNAHNPNRVKCTGKTSTGKPCQMVCLKDKSVCRIHVTQKGT